jgi:hypothetical protein
MPTEPPPRNDPTRPRGVTYDRDSGTATFQGPNGGSQQRMPEFHARAIAHVLDIPFKLAND